MNLTKIFLFAVLALSSSVQAAPSLGGIFKIADIGMRCDLGLPTATIQVKATDAGIEIDVYNDIAGLGPVGFIPRYGWNNGEVDKPSLGPGYMTEQDVGSYSTDRQSFTFLRSQEHVLFDTQKVEASDKGVLYTHQFNGGALSMCQLIRAQ